MGFSFYFMAFTDEEKVDERAKLSVAAKRLLFRVRCAKWCSLVETITPTEKYTRALAPRTLSGASGLLTYSTCRSLPKLS